MDTSKTVLWIFVAVFGTLFGYAPVVLLGADPLGGLSILCGLIGGLFGIWLWRKVGQ